MSFDEWAPWRQNGHSSVSLINIDSVCACVCACARMLARVSAYTGTVAHAYLRLRD